MHVHRLFSIGRRRLRGRQPRGSRRNYYHKAERPRLDRPINNPLGRSRAIYSRATRWRPAPPITHTYLSRVCCSVPGIFFFFTFFFFTCPSRRGETGLPRARWACRASLRDLESLCGLAAGLVWVLGVRRAVYSGWFGVERDRGMCVEVLGKVLFWLRLGFLRRLLRWIDIWWCVILVDGSDKWWAMSLSDDTLLNRVLKSPNFGWLYQWLRKQREHFFVYGYLWYRQKMHWNVISSSIRVI